MAAHEIQTHTSVCQLDDHGFIHITIQPGIVETLADAQATFRAVVALGAGRRLPIMVDLRNMKSQDRDARQYYGSPEVTKVTTAIALLVESRVSKLLANFFIAVTKTTVPTRIFTDEAEALAWMKGYML